MEKQPRPCPWPPPCTQADAANLEQVFPGVTAEIRAMDLVRDDFPHQAHILFCLTLLFRCQFHDAFVPPSLPSISLQARKHLPAGVLPQIAYMCLRLGRLQEVCQPTVSLLFGHPPAGVELIEILVGLPAESSQLSVGQRPQGDSRPRLHPHIGVTFRVAGAYIEHGSVFVVLVNAVRTAVHHRRATVRAAHGFFSLLLHRVHLQVF